MTLDCGYVKAAELVLANPNSNFEFTKLIRIGIILKTKYHMHSGIVYPLIMGQQKVDLWFPKQILWSKTLSPLQEKGRT